MKVFVLRNYRDVDSVHRTKEGAERAAEARYGAKWFKEFDVELMEMELQE